MTAGSTDLPWPSAARAWYSVAVLMVAYLFAFIDRQVLTLLVVPIQQDLHVTDTQLGLLQGLAFGVFYTVLGIPLGWLADRRNRRNLLVAGIALWSLATAACGLASTFNELFLARILVGVGEATLAPAALSIIADSFSAARRPLAMSVYVASGSIGGGLALVLGGAALTLATTLQHAAGMKPWQLVFMMVGLPGLLAAMLLLSISEPERRERAIAAPAGPAWPMLQLLARRAACVVPHIGGISLLSTLVYGMLAWIPTYLLREFGWPLARTGYAFGTAFAILGPIGAVAGGLFARHLARRGVRNAAIITAAIGVTASVPPYLLACIVPSGSGAVLLFGLGSLTSAFPTGSSVAALQDLAPNEMRGRLVAIYYFSLNLIGLGLGPLLVGLLTDRVFGAPSGLGQSLTTTVLLLGPASVVLMWMAARAYRALPL